MPQSRPLSGSTRLAAILGWPLSYTLSPRFQNAALAADGLDAAYVAFAAPDEKAFLALARGLMASPQFVGANITNPYKLAARRLATRLSPAAKAIGAVNTLARQGRAWLGDNTDAPGFVAALRAAQVPLRGKRVLVLGAGGAARAVVWACGQAGAAQVLVLARRPAQAKKTAFLAGKAGLSVAWTPGVLGLLSLGADVVVNTLPGAPLGGQVGRELSPRGRAKAVAVDISYVPLDTPFLKAAKQRGWRSLNGLEMLLQQGRLSYALWFGHAPSMSVLRRSLR